MAVSFAETPATRSTVSESASISSPVSVSTSLYFRMGAVPRKSKKDFRKTWLEPGHNYWRGASWWIVVECPL